MDRHRPALDFYSVPDGRSGTDLNRSVSVDAGAGWGRSVTVSAGADRCRGEIARNAVRLYESIINLDRVKLFLESKMISVYYFSKRCLRQPF
jgi:hypothetical protein